MDTPPRQILNDLGGAILAILGIAVVLSCAPDYLLGVRRDARNTQRAQEWRQLDAMNTSVAQLAATLRRGLNSNAFRCTIS
jgi:hypothetical protein